VSHCDTQLCTALNPSSISQYAVVKFLHVIVTWLF